MGNLLSVAPQRPLLTTAAVDFTIQWALWSVAAFFQTEKFYDLAGSSTFILLAALTLRWRQKNSQLYLRQVIQSGCVTIWALRLGMFLFRRILHEEAIAASTKFEGIHVSFGFTGLIMQGVWVWLTLLPTLILNTSAKDEKLTWRDYVGWLFWLSGFVLESAADHQKSHFRADPANKGKWISTGLWSLCRHPNYLGEILMWSSLFLPASSVMSGHQYWSIISPISVTYFLTRVSGIPILERQGLKRWGHLAEYKKYRQNTASLIPYIW